MSRSFAGMGVVALILILLVIVFANPFKDSIRKSKTPEGALWEGVVADRADQIQLETGGAVPVMLSREGGGWVVESQGSFPADTTAVSSMLRAVRNAVSTGIVSTNPENRSKFQVDSLGVRVTLSGGGSKLLAFTLGKVGTDFTTSYVRPEESNQVHVVRGINRNLFSRPQGFRDRTLFRFDPAAVQSVNLFTPDGSWEVLRGDTAWALSRPGGSPVAAKDTEIDAVLRSLSNLSADGFAEAAVLETQTGLESPAYIVTVRFSGGDESAILVGKKNEKNQFYTARLDRGVVYLLGEWRINSVARKYEDLVEAE